MRMKCIRHAQCGVRRSAVCSVLLGCLFICSGWPTSVVAENLDSILHVLDTCVQQKERYEQVYVKRMDSLVHEAEQCVHLPKALQLWTDIGVREFQHSGDKALMAFDKGLSLARVLGDPRAEADLMQWKALTYGMLGFPWEGERLLDSLAASPQLRGTACERLYTTYYDLYDFYHAYALPAEVTSRNYAFLEQIQDSVKRNLTDPARQAMTIHYAVYDEHQMINQLKAHFKKVPDEHKGVVATVISNKYFMIRDVARRDYYWALAAIYNLRTARHENEALTRLAIRLFETGDKERAVRYTLAAFDDARIYNTRIRKVEVAAPLAKGLAYTLEQQRRTERQLTVWRWVCAGLGVLLLGGGGYVWWSYGTRKRRMKVFEEKYREACADVELLRSDVETKNEYVTRFLELSLDAVFRVEQVRNMVLMKLKAGDTERLQKTLKDPSQFGEFQKTCLKRFDIAFLRLYPDFTKTVNALLQPEGQIELPDTEFLNNELRVLAFMRLGITDSLRIATILGVSVNTVYFYRNKLRRRAIDRDRFEKDVAGICRDA